MAIDFKLTSEQKQLQGLAKEFAKRELIPASGEFDRSESYPHRIIEHAAELGLLNASIPEQAGGLGLGMLEEVLIGEALGYGCMGIYSILMASALGITPLLVAGTPEQHERWLAPLVGTPGLAAFALSEADSGSDAGAMRTRATLKGDEWILQGSKMWITNGGLAEFTVVFATVDPNLGTRGIVALIVPKDAVGFQANKIHHKLGQRAAQTAELVFEDVRLPKECLLGEVGEGFSIAMRTLSRTRIPVAAGSVGIARRAIDESVRYAKERQAFGKPIAELQAIQFKLAEMLMGAETAWLATLRAAWLVDEDLPHNVESAVAKAHASEVAVRAANEAIQVFGGYGYVGEYGVEKLLRDARLNMIYEGTSEIQRVIMARALLKD